MGVQGPSFWDNASTSFSGASGIPVLVDPYNTTSGPPAGASDLDLLLAVVYYRSIAPTPPAGWTALDDQQAISGDRGAASIGGSLPVRIAVWWKQVDPATDVNFTTYPMGGTDANTRGFARTYYFRNADPATLTAWWFPEQGDTVTLPSIPLVEQGGTISVVAGAHRKSTGPGASITDAESGASGSPGLTSVSGGVFWASAWLSPIPIYNRYDHVAAHPTLPAGDVYRYDADAGGWDVVYNSNALETGVAINGYVQLRLNGYYDWQDEGAATTPSCASRGTYSAGEAITGELSPLDIEWTVSATGNVTDMQVGLRVDHPALGDLYVELVSPDGWRIPLFDGQTGNLDHDLGGTGGLLWFHADLDLVLPELVEQVDFLGPYVGNFREPNWALTYPHATYSNMGDYVGGSAAGTWTLRLWDWDIDGLNGTLVEAVLRMCVDGELLMLVV